SVALKVRTQKASLLMAWFFGLLIFIDDYFNSLAVGTVMRPITDSKGVPRAKLAYILDSTAAPVCIIAPVSSWVITVMSIVKGSEGFGQLGITEFDFFIRSIPYNLYALLAIIMVLVIILTNRDFGPMAASKSLS
ncbi:MAG: Na+/H+ antiporter NhaC family protein, partial [Sphaerochaetaceae bacterium]